MGPGNEARYTQIALYPSSSCFSGEKPGYKAAHRHMHNTYTGEKPGYKAAHRHMHNTCTGEKPGYKAAHRHMHNTYTHATVNAYRLQY